MITPGPTPPSVASFVGASTPHEAEWWGLSDAPTRGKKAEAISEVKAMSMVERGYEATGTPLGSWSYSN